MTTTINLIVLYVRDLERSRQFYAQIGLQFAREKHGNGPEHFACESSSIVFELYPHSAPDASTNVVRLGFCVESVDQTLAQMTSCGFEAQATPNDSPWGRRVVVRDPDGNFVEFTSQI